MKKLLLLIFIGLNAPMFLAQSPIWIADVANGGYQGSTGFYGYYNYSRAQHIYKSEELEAGKISSVSLYIGDYTNGRHNGIIENLSVKMTHVTYDAFASATYEESNLATVWEGGIDPNALTGWIRLDLKTPFDYNGTDNLLIEFRSEDGSYSNNCEPLWAYTPQTTTGEEYKTVKGYSDINNPPTNQIQSTYRADVIIGFAQENLVNGTELIGDNSATYNKSNFVNGYYSYSHIQNIYKTNELHSGTINQVSAYIGGYFNDINYGKIENVTIELGHTSQNTFSTATYITGLNQVWTGDVIPNEDGWMTINLDTPFVYNGTDNLVVDIFSNDGDWTDNGAPEFAYTVQGDYKTVKDYADALPLTTAYQSTYRTDMIFGYQSDLTIAEEITIGTHESRNQFNVAEGYYGYSKMQYIYEASELQQGDISRLGFYVGNYYTEANYGKIENVSVLLGHITTNEFATATYANDTIFDTVWVGDLIPHDNGWHNIDLATPFSYNGTDNLILEIHSQDGNWADNPIPEFSYTVQTTNPYKAVKDYTDVLPFNTVYRSTQRADVRVGFAHMEVTAITTDVVGEQLGSITLNITGGTPPYNVFWDDDNYLTQTQFEELYWDTIIIQDSVTPPDTIYPNLSYTYSDYMNEYTSQTLNDIPSGLYRAYVYDSEGEQFYHEIMLNSTFDIHENNGITQNNLELTKPSGTEGWDTYIQDENTVGVDDKGLISFNLDNETDTYIIGYKKVGSTSQTLPYDDIAYGFKVDNTTLFSIENGEETVLGSIAQNDKLTIEKKGTEIFYYKNESLLKQSSEASNIYQLKTHLYSVGSRIDLKGKGGDKRFRFVTNIAQLECSTEDLGSIDFSFAGNSNNVANAYWTYPDASTAPIILGSGLYTTGTISNLQSGKYIINVQTNGGSTYSKEYWVGTKVVWTNFGWYASTLPPPEYNTLVAQGQGVAYTENVLRASEDGWYRYTPGFSSVQAQQAYSIIKYSSDNLNYLYSINIFDYSPSDFSLLTIRRSDPNISGLWEDVGANFIKVKKRAPILYEFNKTLNEFKISFVPYNSTSPSSLSFSLITTEDINIRQYINGDNSAVVNCIASFGCKSTSDICNLTLETPLEDSYCTGDYIPLSVNSSTGENINNYVFNWTPATNITCTDCPNPIVYPTESTTYTMGYTYTDLFSEVVCPPITVPITTTTSFPCGEETIEEIYSCCFSNYGAGVYVAPMTNVNVYCNLLNEIGGNGTGIEKGEFINKGDINVAEDWIHNGQNNLYLSNEGNSDFIGGVQQMRGNSNTHFYNLDFTGGTGVRKEILIDEYAENTLNLYENELATIDNTFHVENSDPAAITRIGGYVSTDGTNGYLKRKTDDVTPYNYLYPLGSVIVPFRYRPVEIEGANNGDNFSVHFENTSPSDVLNGLDIVNKAPNVESLSDDYFYKILTNSSSSSITLRAFFPQSEGAFQSVSHWEANGQTPPPNWWIAAPGANGSTVASVDPNTLGLIFASATGVTNFNTENFILSEAGFFINTDNFGNPNQGPDTDGDGIPDTQDPDVNGDGILDTNTDADGDGIIDTFDVTYTGGQDLDGNGIDDIYDPFISGGPDSDGDGKPDVVDSDANGDGIIDATTPIDADGDCIIDTFDVTFTGGDDSDGNGIDDLFDPIISGGTDTDGDGSPDAVDCDADGDGLIDTPPDDGDGIIDTFQPGFTGGQDSDGNGIDDNYDSLFSGGPDSDGDGIPDAVDSDANGDGIIDAPIDADGDGIIDTYDVTFTGGVDIDGDGIDDNFDPLVGGNGTTVTITGGSGSGTGNTPDGGGLGDQNSTGNGTGDINFSPTPVAGTYQMNFSTDDCGIDGVIEFTILPTGQIDPTTIYYYSDIQSGFDGSLSTDVYSLGFPNSGFIVNSTPNSLLEECVNSLKIKMGSTLLGNEEYILNITGGAITEDIEIITTDLAPDPNILIGSNTFTIFEKDGVTSVYTTTVNTSSNAHTILLSDLNTNWVPATVDAGLYKFELDLVGIDIIKGQFFIKE